MVKDEKIKEIIRNVAHDHGIPYVVAERIYEHQFKFVRKTMTNAQNDMLMTFKAVRLRGLGIFYLGKKLGYYLAKKHILYRDESVSYQKRSTGD